MSLVDIAWNIFRKSLSSGLYRKLKNGPLGRPNRYNTLPTYQDIFTHYQSAGLSFRGKRVLEVGCGEQFFTALFFLSEGAESVALVDPAFSDRSAQLLETHAELFAAESGLQPVSSPSDRVSFLRGLEDIPESSNGSVDIICSHFVLEHFYDLENYFVNAARLLAPGGLCYNFVDLSDHAYHLFDSRKWTRRLYRKRMLYHLRYSDAVYDFITDKRIWVNRLLVPAYRALAKKHNLEIVSFSPQSCRRAPIHPDVLKRNPGSTPEELFVTHFALTLAAPRANKP